MSKPPWIQVRIPSINKNAAYRLMVEIEKTRPGSKLNMTNKITQNKIGLSMLRYPISNSDGFSLNTSKVLKMATFATSNIDAEKRLNNTFTLCELLFMLNCLDKLESAVIVAGMPSGKKTSCPRKLCGFQFSKKLFVQIKKYRVPKYPVRSGLFICSNLS